MKVAVIGKGGREHALVKALQESPKVERIFVLPGNPGMEGVERLETKNHEQLVQFCLDLKIDIVIVGPEEPLVKGLSDLLRQSDVLTLGPEKRAAQLEGSKEFAKKFMKKYGIPTASYFPVWDVKDVEEKMALFKPPYVLKMDGLAGGKGVFICSSPKELLTQAQSVLKNPNQEKSSKPRALLEEFQKGSEMSFFILTNSKDYKPLPIAQDYKKLRDGDQGPNTGGMGSLAPLRVSKDLYNRILNEIVEPTVQGLNKEGFLYCGVLFIGLIITDQGPKVLEYNIRWGDPEAQVLLPLLDGDWAEVFYKLAQGHWTPLRWKKKSVACLVMAAENYPESPVKGTPIGGDIFHSTKNSYFLHGATTFDKTVWKTNGGRVINAIGLGESEQEALNNAYSQSEMIHWPGVQMRKDIGGRGL